MRAIDGRTRPSKPGRTDAGGREERKHGWEDGYKNEGMGDRRKEAIFEEWTNGRTDRDRTQMPLSAHARHRLGHSRQGDRTQKVKEWDS